MERPPFPEHASLILSTQKKKGNWNSMFKRIGLLVLANLAVFIMLSVILTVVQMVFGVNFGTMAGSSLNLSALFIFSMELIAARSSRCS